MRYCNGALALAVTQQQDVLHLPSMMVTPLEPLSTVTNSLQWVNFFVHLSNLHFYQNGYDCDGPKNVNSIESAQVTTVPIAPPSSDEYDSAVVFFFSVLLAGIGSSEASINGQRDFDTKGGVSTELESQNKDSRQLQSFRPPSPLLYHQRSNSCDGTSPISIPRGWCPSRLSSLRELLSYIVWLP